MQQIAVLACLAALWAACTSTEPQVKPCTVANSVPVGALAVAAYKSVAPGPDGCASFTANTTSDTIEYLVVAQSAGSNPNRVAQFRLAGEAQVTAPPIMASLQAGGVPSPAEQFHTMLREREAKLSYERVAPGERALNSVQPPPSVGEQRVFRVCPDLRCQPPMRNITGQVVSVGPTLALYVDVTALNSLTQADYDSLVEVFDERAYAVDTAAFGLPSDVDLNGVVIALMTPAINRLVSDSVCRTSGFVAGYFFGADLALPNNSNYNNTEMFYALVPDPAGQYSCAHSVARVKQLIPVVFVHELQHMISFNYHVIQPGASFLESEVLWLNEALSHYAEELGGRTYLPDDNAMFSSYLTGNVRNAYDYLSNTGDHFLVNIFGSGTLGERGAGWLFMRYLVDQLATDTTTAAWNAVTRQLVQTANVGVANIQARTGVPFEQTIARWGLANWVSDLPNFATPPELKYRSWRFRTTYGGLYPSIFPKPYPLDPPVTLAADVDVTGTLRSGSGVYERVLQAPGSPEFTLQLAETNGTPFNPGVDPRLTVIRVR